MDVQQLESLPISDFRNLPNTSGIYFALDSQGKVHYVGQAGDMRQRWVNGHHRAIDLLGLGVSRLAWQLAALEDLDGLEAHYIENLAPTLNKTKIKNTSKSAGLQPLEGFEKRLFDLEVKLVKLDVKLECWKIRKAS